MAFSSGSWLPLIILFHLILSYFGAFSLAARDQFQKWYPEYAFIFDQILRENCSTQYNTYLHGKKNTSNIDRYSGGNWNNQLVEAVVNCILQSSSEFIKSSSASAQVLLGLTPSMLAVLGPSTEETSLLFVVDRRPILALFIAAGSPAVFPMRSFDFKDPVGLLKDREGRLRPPPFSYAWTSITTVLEYLLVLTAIANIAFLSRQLGVQVVCNFAPERTNLVLLWAFLIPVIHLIGGITLKLRARVLNVSDSDSDGNRRNENEKVGWEPKQPSRLTTLAQKWIQIQLTPFEEQGPLCVDLEPETNGYVFLSWFTASLTIVHVIYGTLVFSSMLFISVKDSLAVVGRFMASVVVCRVVLMYELTLLRDTIKLGGGGGGGGLRDRKFILPNDGQVRQVS